MAPVLDGKNQAGIGANSPRQAQTRNCERAADDVFFGGNHLVVLLNRASAGKTDRSAARFARAGDCASRAAARPFGAGRDQKGKPPRISASSRARLAVFGKSQLRMTPLSATMSFSGESGRAELDDGDAVFFSSAEKGFVIHRPTPVLFLGLRVPRKALALLAANLDGALLRLVTGRSAPLRLLTKYLRCVGADVADEPQILGRTVAAHVYDLIALIVGANADAVAAAEDRGVKAARLRAIKTDIARHLADGELTIADVAARQGVTLRYVHKLFEGEGASFSRYVLDRRLEAAYRVLTDQRQDHRSICRSLSIPGSQTSLTSIGRFDADMMRPRRT